MSIYASFGCVDSADHKVGCKRLAKKRPVGAIACIMTESGTYWVDESRPCTCGVGPIRYQHSGILPSDSDERGGCFSLGYIPGHIDDGTRKPLSDNMQPCWPWLRVSIWGAKPEDPTVVLTREQVQSVRDSLNWWLENTPPQKSEDGQ